jgi:hypothetical protein
VHEAKLVEPIADLLCDPLGVLHRTVFENDSKLVTTQAGEGIAHPDRFAKQLRGLL